MLCTTLFGKEENLNLTTTYGLYEREKETMSFLLFCSIMTFGRIINEHVCIAAVYTKYFQSLRNIKDSQEILFVHRNSGKK